MKSGVLVSIAQKAGRGRNGLIRRCYSDQSIGKSSIIGNDNVMKHTSQPFNSLDEYGILESLLFPPQKIRAVNRKPVKDTSKEYTLPFIRQIKRLRLLEERRRPLIERNHEKLTAVSLSDGGISIKDRSHLNKNHHSKFGNQNLLKDLSPEMIDKITVLMSSSYLSKSDIDHWLKIHIPSSDSLNVRQYTLEQCLNYMIVMAGKRSLKPIMDYLEKVWKYGFESTIKISSPIARNQTIAIFRKAFDIFEPTEYSIDNRDHRLIARLGIEDIDAFRALYRTYLRIYSNPIRTDRVLDDLWFQLVSKCGSIESADEIIVSHYLESSELPSYEAIDVFVKSLSKHILLQKQIYSESDKEFNLKVKNDLTAYRELLVSDRVTPAVIEFLLLWANDLSEVYSVLELAKNSRYADAIFSNCQVAVIEAVVKGALDEGLTATSASASASTSTSTHTSLVNPKIFIPIHTRAMAHMFGTLNRFTKCSKGITPEALDKCLLLSAKYGNSAGMYRALAMRLNLEDNRASKPPAIDSEILGQVFDCFPIASGAMSQEKKSSPSLWAVQDAIIADPARDQAILYHLRTTISPSGDTKIFQKYLSALGRCGRSDRLYCEWNDFFSPINSETSVTSSSHIDWSQSPEIVLEFLSAFKTAGSIDQGLKVLESILHISDTESSKYYTASVGILRDVFRYEILPLSDSLTFVADWFMHQKSSTQWLADDIQSIFDEIGGPHSVSSLSLGEAKVASHIGQEVANTILQVRGGLDVERSMDSLNQLLGRTNDSVTSRV